MNGARNVALRDVCDLVREDAGELVDRAGDPACRPLLLEYAAKLLEWRMTHAEQALTDCWLTPQGVFWQPQA